jgi:hypothetical protein
MLEQHWMADVLVIITWSWNRQHGLHLQYYAFNSLLRLYTAVNQRNLRRTKHAHAVNQHGMSALAFMNKG